MRIKRQRPGTIRQSPEATLWRSRPLHTGSIGFWIHPYLEQLFGRIALDNRRTDTVRGLLEYAVNFANHEEMQYLPRWIWAEKEDDPTAQAILPELTEERVVAWREEVKRILSAAGGGSSGADDLDFERQPEDLFRAIEKRMGPPQIDWTLSIDREIGCRSYGVIRTPDAFVGVVMSLLLVKENRKLICRCRECSRFFLMEQTDGKPRKAYCSDACMRAADVAGSAGRQRDRYKRRRAAELLTNEWVGRVPTEDKITNAVREAFKADPAATAEQLAKSAAALLYGGRRSKQ